MSRTDWTIIGVIAAVVAVVSLFFAVRLAMRLVTVRRALGAMGAKGKVVFWGALIYTIFPVDILPDPIYLDDVTVLGGALWFLTRLLRRKTTMAEAGPHARRLAELGGRVAQSRRAVRPGTTDRTP
jgi:uncharacterized membrane protein YkvA (DUF1232 family)